MARTSVKSNHSEEQHVGGEKHQTDHEAAEAPRPKAKKLIGEEMEDTPKAASKPHREELTQETSGSKSGDAERPGEQLDVPSNILEKGIIYFFVRGRVDVDEPEGMEDIARTYILMRPVATDAKLGAGTLRDAGTTRLLVLPKKQLPRSGRERYMSFVDMAGASYDEIKGKFLASSERETKTKGTRHTPAATPVGEGVYAITTTGRESHLAYAKTLPQELGEVQKKLGIKDKGSFIISTKNPQYKGPAKAQLPVDPKFPKEILDEFRNLRWLPSRPSHLNYANVQVLLVGESSGLEKAMEPQKEDMKSDKEEPLDVLENLEHEDLKRMRDLPGGDSASVFADLHAQAKFYPKVQTTF